jgi:hypothetical protein
LSEFELRFVSEGLETMDFESLEIHSDSLGLCQRGNWRRFDRFPLPSNQRFRDHNTRYGRVLGNFIPDLVGHTILDL